MQDFSIGWKGQSGTYKNSDGIASQFESVHFGLRAGMMDLRTDIKNGQNTIEKIMVGFNGRGGFATGKPYEYIEFLCKELGINKTDQIEPTRENLIRLSKSITKKEIGISDYKKINPEQWEMGANAMGLLAQHKDVPDFFVKNSLLISFIALLIVGFIFPSRKK